jgi:hypothetical protein
VRLSRDALLGRFQTASHREEEAGVLLGVLRAEAFAAGRAVAARLRGQQHFDEGNL